MNTGSYFGLNRVAADVWVLLTAGESLGAIVDSLVQRYQVDIDVLESETFRLCGELASANLLRAST